jgi:hypothetical protein
VAFNVKPLPTDLDWAQAWFAEFRVIGMPIYQQLSQGNSVFRETLQACLSPLAQSAGGHPIQFVLQEELPLGMAYETYIAQTGRVPTRANLHDFFNALMWWRWPRSKQVINRLQSREIARDGVSGRRGPIRDALTLLDESGLVIVDSSVEGEAQAVHAALNWSELLCKRRDEWGKTLHPLVTGHALLEHLVQPYKSLTTHVLWLHLPGWSENFSDGVSVEDAVLAEAIETRLLKPSVLLPLPVLGLPGWSPGQDETFYADERVFRRSRRVKG